MSLVLTFDESMRRRLYLGIAAAYEGAAAPLVDRMVRGHRLPGQTRFHAKNESDSRRRVFLTDCVNRGLVRLWIYTAPFPATAARRVIVAALTVDAVKNAAGRLVVERGDPGRDHLDRQEINRALKATGGDLAYSHEPPGSYPGLEIADLAAWAYGAGSDWHRRTVPMIEFIRELSP